MLFQTERAIFRWADNALTVIRPISRFNRASLLDGQLYITMPETGLNVLEGDTFRPLPGTAALATEVYPVVLRYDERRLLIGRRFGGFFLYDSAALTPFPTELDEYLKSASLYRGIALPDGTIALSTTNAGMALMDRAGRQLMTLDRGQDTLALQTATAIENAQLFERTVQAARERERLLALHQEVEVARAKLESEMKLAARIQADLFPPSMPAIAGYDLAARNRPARQCGGDYYDAIAVGSGGDARVLLCVADVAGKGLPASLVMSNMQATLRALLGRTDSLPALAGLASDLLFASTAPEKYVTAALADLEPRTGAIRFVGAGHVDTLILRANGETVTLGSTGTPLGLLPPLLPYGEVNLRLEPGDTLVLFSDGVTEAQNADEEEYGEARLVDCLRAVADQPAAVMIERLMASIDGFAGGAPQFDDITLLVARRA